jgi:hypothetical protein
VNVKEIPSTSGVYRLYDGEECIYVGGTSNMRKRVSRHEYKRLSSDVVTEFVPLEKIKEVEQYYIDTLQPRLNKKGATLARSWISSESVRPVNVQLNAEDYKMLEEIRETLLSTHGKVSSIAVVRMALRKMEQEQK